MRRSLIHRKAGASMECIAELFFEIFFEAAVEGIFYLYLWLMSLAIPEKSLSEKTKNKAKKIIKVYCAILILVIIAGLILIACSDGPGFVETLGRYLTFIPLALTGAQIMLGIVFRIIAAVRKKR